MRIVDRLQAMTMHATARWTVHYGEALRVAGSELPAPEVVRVGTRHGRLPVHVYAPPGGGTGAHVHCHGGAWLMRHPEMDDWWCRYLAARTGATVHNVDFRTGPYVTYPVAQEQCHDVAAWVAGRHEHVSVGGFSSGGGMAAAVCLQARDLGSFVPVFHVLGVPALDLASELPSGAGMISPSLRALVRRVYFPDVASRSEPCAYPVLAPDLSGLPPALVLTAERDTLRRDGLRYVERLREAGIEVWHHETPGVDHYFLTEDPARAEVTMAEVAGRSRRGLTDHHHPRGGLRRAHPVGASGPRTPRVMSLASGRPAGQGAGMATWADVERLAGGLPEVSEGTSWGNRAWQVAGKTFVWERPLGGKDRAALGDAVPDGPVLGVRVADEGEKAELLAAQPDTCFTIPHFDGHTAVLVRLDEVDVDVLAELVTDAWRSRATVTVRRSHDS